LSPRVGPSSGLLPVSISLGQDEAKAYVTYRRARVATRLATILATTVATTVAGRALVLDGDTRVWPEGRP
jgi:hypothetical protein